MRRAFPLLAGVAVLAGCSAPGGANSFDPFGRTRIEPPRTGWIQRRPAADPYYSDAGQAPRPAFAVDAQGPRPENDGNVGESCGPPGNRRVASTEQAAAPASLAGDHVRIPLAAREAPEWSGSQVADSSPGRRPEPERDGIGVPTGSRASPSGQGSLEARSEGPATSPDSPDGETVVRTIRPRPKALRRPGMASRPIDIMDLPPAGSPRTTQAPERLGGVRLASNSEALDGRQSTTIGPGKGEATNSTNGSGTSSSLAGRYGYDPHYRWLKGRLEYSQIERRWKLRYIPIDGRTDEFGGSVVLSNPSALSGYERGEFVEVHGKLGPAPQDDPGYAPEFQIERVQRLGS
jgi:hypothetical protein